MNERQAMKRMRLRRNRFVGIVLAAAVGALTLRAGDLLPPGTPGPTMHTLEEIYQQEAMSLQLANTILFPRTLSADSTSMAKGFYEATTLDVVDADLVPANLVKGATLFGVTGSAVSPSGDATSDQVLAGFTFSRAGQAGLTGSMPNRGAVSLTPGAASQTIPQGYHDGAGVVAGDGDLLPANIATGISLFNVAGSAVRPTGNATVGQVLSGSTFSKLGAVGLTGAMPNRGAVSLTPGAASQAIPQGYHNGSGWVAGDADLVSANIATGITLFDVAGSAMRPTGNATVDQVLSGSTFSKLGAVGLTGIMPNRGAVSITPGAASQTIPQGYHNGSGSVAGDADLASANIAAGVTVFDVAGTLIRATGNAALDQVLAGATFSRTGAAGLSGTLPNRGAVSITPGAASQAIPQGYHNGSGVVQGDADLTAANILAGANVFGVVGSLAEATGNAADNTVLAGQTFSRTGAAGRTGTMVNRGAVSIMPAATNQVIQQGYHNGSGTVLGDAGLIPTNLRTNVTVFGVTGTYAGAAFALRRTGQTTSLLPEDDGDLQRGLTWPSPRFIDHGDETVTDQLTGLMWVKTPIALVGNGTAMPWTNAVQFCEGLVHAGYEDWHLPTVREYLSLVDYGRSNLALPAGHPFLGINNAQYYWSGTTAVGMQTYAVGIGFSSGVSWEARKDYDGYAWPVRGVP
jgi:hypothetical protein